VSVYGLRALACAIVVGLIIWAALGYAVLGSS
jgi:hypothetical protein